jgi:hypothetical protein
MHFLKRPPPPKPGPRDRERARRRGERELEEVSSFFLQKGMPEASGRYQPTVSGASSRDRATRGSSAFSVDVPPHQSRPGEEYDHRSPEMYRESSRGESNWTWSSSHTVPIPGITETSSAGEHGLLPKSTPSPIQNALGRTRGLENTENDCAERPSQRPGARFHFKDISSTREPLAVVSAGIVNRQPEMSTQVQIVRYHDRGVMVSEETERAARGHQEGTGAWPDPVKQPPGMTSNESPPAAGIPRPSPVGPEKRRAGPPQEEREMGAAAAFDAAHHDPGPDRPRSAKYRNIIEKPEAAAENIESQEHQNDLTRGSNYPPPHGNVQSASSYNNHHVPDSRSASQHACLGTRPFFTDARQQGLFEGFQQISPLTIEYKPRNSQPAHNLNLFQWPALERSGNSHPVSNLAQPVSSGRSACCGPFDALSTAHYTIGDTSSGQVIPPNQDPASHILLNDWVATSSGQFLRNQSSPGAQSVFLGTADIPSLRSGRQQSLEEYISQMENEALCYPQDVVDDDSPIPSSQGMQDNPTPYRACIPQEYQSNIDVHGQDMSVDGQLQDRPIDDMHYGGGGMMHNSDVDLEEERFMSTFWRPNYL